MSGNQVNDVSDNGRNGTVVGTVDLGASGVSNTGVGFNGTGNLIRPGTDTPAINLKDQEFTVETWVRPDANLSETQTYINLFGGNGREENFSVGLNPDGSIRVSLSSPDSDEKKSTVRTTSPGLIDLNNSDTWYHIVVSYDDDSGGLLRIFLNGASVAVSNSETFEGKAPALTVGAGQNVRGQGFNGTVDEVAIYNGVLTNEQIIGHYLLGERTVRTINPLLNSDGTARAGDIDITAETISISGRSDNGFNSGLFASTDGAFSGDGGNINVQADSLSISDGGQISARAQGQGDAGKITIDLAGALLLNGADISTAAVQSSGGAIAITANAMRLLGDSDIRTDIAAGQDTGGNITLRAESILAFDDSDILAFSRDGRGGNIVLDTPVFFGENFLGVASDVDPALLDLNGRVDVNASGSIAAGTVVLPDVSLVQNTLTTLPDTLLSPEALLAGSCVARSQSTGGRFVISGTEGLPQTPMGGLRARFDLGAVVPFSAEGDTEEPALDTSAEALAIIEPHHAYRLADGRLVLSQDCP